jgi:hypothetical protein
MGDYQDNMSEEKRPPQLLPEGARLVSITEMISGVSKSGGNPQFITTIEDTKTHKSMVIYLVNVPKKRWMLKSLLTACEVPAGQDGVYNWSVKDVLGKSVIAMIEHAPEDWINTKGETVTNMKAKVTEFIQPEKDSTGEACAWED